jgi:hypothetical protein
MPQNAIIRADGTGDYTTIIAWAAAEGGSNYGAVTVGRVDGFFDQGSSSLFLSGSAPNGLKLEAFNSAIAFDGTQRNLCGLRCSSSTRAVDFATSTDITIDGLEIVYDGTSGTDRCLEDSSSGTYTLINSLVVVESESRIYIGNFVFTDTVIVSEAVSSFTSNGAASTYSGCNVFGQNSNDMLGNSDTSTNTVVYNSGSGADFGGSSTQTNTASSDTTASTLTNIVIADNFVSTTPIASKDYRIKSGSPLDTNGIGSFVQVSSGITITPLSINSSSVSIDPVIQYSAIVNLLPSTINSSSIALNPAIQYSASINITPSVINTASVSLDPSIQYSAELFITPNVINSNSASLNPIVSYSASLNISPSVINSASTSLNPTIQYSSILNLAPSVINSNSQAPNPVITYTSALIILPQTINTASASLDPVIEYKAVINLTPNTINSLSVSINPFISTGQTQIIGNVTAGFANDLYSVKYKLSGITVNFKG